VEQITPKNIRIGKLGEDLAVDFLLSRGYKILDRNYWKPYGEIDIVALKQNSIHFVEVKTVSRDPDVNRGTFDEYEPEDNMHRYKQERLRRVIETYLAQNNKNDERDWFIDLICVFLTPQGKLLKIDLIEDITLS